MPCKQSVLPGLLKGYLSRLLIFFFFFPFSLQIDASCLTWEGQQFQGKAAIVEKLSVSVILTG